MGVSGELACVDGDPTLELSDESIMISDALEVGATSRSNGDRGELSNTDESPSLVGRFCIRRMIPQISTTP